jgi:uncharacterized protein YcbX
VRAGRYARQVKLAAIHIYPVKSFAGQAVQEAPVEPWGLLHDRRWVVLEPDGTRLSAREEHRMLGLSARPTQDGIRITSRDGKSMDVTTPTDGELVSTLVSRLESVRLADSGVNGWLSDALERSVRLGWLDDPRRRSVSETHGGVDGDSLTLADAGPLLLTTTSSLQQLNAWMEPPGNIEMARFRPNVIVDGVPEPFEEDRWRRLRIGGAEFRFAEICDRCVMTTLDPQTLLGGKEPLRTLAKHRQWDHKTWFGIRLIPTTSSVIHVGKQVEVLRRMDRAGHGC